MPEQETSKQETADKQTNKLISRFKKNPWIIATIVLGIIVIVLLISNFTGITGNVISERDIGTQALEFFNTQLSQTPGTLDSVNLKNGVYEVNIDYGGNVVPVYFTKDGNFIAQGNGLIPITGNTVDNSQTETPIEIPKSDKPKVEIVITSYCPYGMQAIKGIMPVAELLKDKIDFKVKYFNIPSHGEKELIEGKRQICIREEQPDKYWSYMRCILDSDDVYNPADVTQCQNKVGINNVKLNNSLQKDIDRYYSGNSEIDVDASSSPTLIVNGVEASSGRSPSAYLSTICSAFNKVPEECSEKLSSTSPSPGFGYGEGQDSSAQC